MGNAPVPPIFKGPSRIAGGLFNRFPGFCSLSRKLVFVCANEPVERKTEILRFWYRLFLVVILSISHWGELNIC